MSESISMKQSLSDGKKFEIISMMEHYYCKGMIPRDVIFLMAQELSINNKNPFENEVYLRAMVRQYVCKFRTNENRFISHNCVPQFLANKLWIEEFKKFETIRLETARNYKCRKGNRCTSCKHYCKNGEVANINYPLCKLRNRAIKKKLKNFKEETFWRKW